MEGNGKFKIILLAIFGLFIILGLVAFATFKTSNTDTSSTVTVNIWGLVDKTTFDNFANKYKLDNRLEFKYSYLQKDINTFDSEVLEAIATGKAPDVILIPQELIRKYSDKVNKIGYKTIPLRTFKDTFIEESELYLDSDGIFAIPFFVDPLVMYFNRDIFSSAGIPNPPANWSEFQGLSKKISKNDGFGNITDSIASLGEYRNINNAKALISAMFMQSGSQIVGFNENGNISSYLYYKSPTDIEIPTISALRFYTDFSNPKKDIYSWNRALPQSKQFFLSENLATYFGFASEASDLAVKNPNLNFDVAMLPQIVSAKTKVTFGELYGFAFLKASPNLLPAYNLVSALTSAPAISVLLQATNFAPARRDIIAAGALSSAKTVFYNSALISKGWLDPNFKATETVFQNMVEDVTSGKSNIDASIQKADRELGGLLQ